METVALQPSLELSNNTESSKVAELMQKASERWWKMQVFLGKNALTKMAAMETVGTGVDLALMASGLHDPMTREPIAASVDLAVLHKLSGAHENSANQDTTRGARLKKLGGSLLMLSAVIGAQKAGIAVAEHAGLAQGYDGGVQIGSKWGALLSINGANALKQRAG